MNSSPKLKESMKSRLLFFETLGLGDGVTVMGNPGCVVGFEGDRESGLTERAQ